MAEIDSGSLAAERLARGVRGSARDLKRDWHGWSETERIVARTLLLGAATVLIILAPALANAFIR